jgi:hypothetical protein
MRKYIPVAAPALVGNERAYVLDCLDSTWISSRGAYIDRFERAFAEFCGVAVRDRVRPVANEAQVGPVVMFESAPARVVGLFTYQRMADATLAAYERFLEEFPRQCSYHPPV